MTRLPTHKPSRLNPAWIKSRHREATPAYPFGACQELDKPAQSITSSARASNVGGITSPSGFGGLNGVQERRCRLHENAACDYDDASCRQWELRSLDNFDAGFVAKFLTQDWNLRLRLRIH